MDDADTVATEGQPWPGNEIEIRDPGGNVLTTGEEGGHLCVESAGNVWLLQQQWATARTLVGGG